MTKEYVPIIRYDDSRNRWEVSSETYKGHNYAVFIDLINGRLVCSCPWGRGRAQATKRDCKHVRAVYKWLEALPAKEREKYI